MLVTIQTTVLGDKQLITDSQSSVSSYKAEMIT